jgi:lipopolysaccharide transport system ATP-binding protein
VTAPAIDIRGLCKTYRVWNSSREMLLEVLTTKRRHQEFHALSDVDLVVPRGSVVGVLGRNGAGKSTLLRIVAGTLDHTSGNITVHGRIAAILELGTGFHPEYSGRDNVYLGGICLGLSHSEIAARFDEIVDFAELWEFIDQPFRTYSSGMQARLTFAVATSVEPDVLIIDEALAVGDARFQLKSFDRIRDFKRRGKSILLVSHNINQVVAICDRALLLERGRVIADGDPNRIGNLYHEMLFGPSRDLIKTVTNADLLPGDSGDGVEFNGAAHGDASATMHETTVDKDLSAIALGLTAPTISRNDSSGDVADVASVQAAGREMRYGLRRLEIISAHIVDVDNRKVHILKSLERYRLIYRIRADVAASDVHVGFLLRDPRGLEIFGWDTKSAGAGVVAPFAPGETRDISIEFTANLGGGTFFLTVTVARDDFTKEDVRFDALEIVVQPVLDIHTSSVVNLDVHVDGR